MTVFRLFCLRRSLRATAVAAALAGSAFARAGDIAYVSPPAPTDPELAKVTFVRLWYVGNSKNDPPICLVRELAGQAPIFLENHLQPGLFTSYVRLKPGKGKMHILDGNVEAPKEPADEIPIKDKKLTEPIEADFSPGAYHTLLLEAKDGKLVASLIEDTRPPEAGAPVMRVRNLSGYEGWSIRLLNRSNEPIQNLWNSASGATGESIRLPGPGVYRVEVRHEENGELRVVGLFETRLGAGAPFSIVLRAADDGHAFSSMFFDAAP